MYNNVYYSNGVLKFIYKTKKTCKNDKIKPQFYRLFESIF